MMSFRFLASLFAFAVATTDFRKCADTCVGDTNNDQKLTSSDVRTCFGDLLVPKLLYACVFQASVPTYESLVAGDPDTYIVIEVDGAERHRTSVVRGATSPSFVDGCVMLHFVEPDTPVIFKVYDSDVIKDDYQGSLTLKNDAVTRIASTDTPQSYVWKRDGNEAYSMMASLSFNGAPNMVSIGKMCMMDAKLNSADIFNGATDAYVRVTFDTVDTELQWPKIKNDNNPDWQMSCKFIGIMPAGTKMTVQIIDHDATNPDNVVLSGSTVLSETIERNTYVRLSDDSNQWADFRFLPLNELNPPPPPPPPPPATPVILCIDSGKFDDRDTITQSDPVVKVKIGGSEVYRVSKSNDNTPTWSNACKNIGGLNTGQVVSFEVIDDDTPGSDPLGSNTWYYAPEKCTDYNATPRQENLIELTLRYFNLIDTAVTRSTGELTFHCHTTLNAPPPAPPSPPPSRYTAIVYVDEVLLWPDEDFRTEYKEANPAIDIGQIDSFVTIATDGNVFLTTATQYHNVAPGFHEASSPMQFYHGQVFTIDVHIRLPQSENPNQHSGWQLAGSYNTVFTRNDTASQFSKRFVFGNLWAEVQLIVADSIASVGGAGRRRLVDTDQIRCCDMNFDGHVDMVDHEIMVRRIDTGDDVCESCSNTCSDATNGLCQDGGASIHGGKQSTSSTCAFGTDCRDCGPRRSASPTSMPAPPSSPTSNFMCQPDLGHRAFCADEKDRAAGLVIASNQIGVCPVGLAWANANGFLVVGEYQQTSTVNCQSAGTCVCNTTTPLLIVASPPPVPPSACAVDRCTIPSTWQGIVSNTTSLTSNGYCNRVAQSDLVAYCADKFRAKFPADFSNMTDADVYLTMSVTGDMTKFREYLACTIPCAEGTDCEDCQGLSAPPPPETPSESPSIALPLVLLGGVGVVAVGVYLCRRMDVVIERSVA